VEGKWKDKERAGRKSERAGCQEAMNSGSLCLSFINTTGSEMEGGGTPIRVPNSPTGRLRGRTRLVSPG